MIDYNDPSYTPWSHTDDYREAAITFLKNKYYTPFPEGTISYNNYWDNQEYYIRHGFTSKHTKRRISGLYYLYLNFCPIYNKKEKRYTFPDFWDLDAAYYDELEQNMGLGLAGDSTRTLGTVIAKARQKGAEQPNSEPILTSEGWKIMGDIKPGTMVYTPSGETTKVLEIFPQGKKDVYEFTFLDGRKVKAGLDHRWEVQDNRSSKGKTIKVLTTRELLSTKITYKVTAPTINGLKKYTGYRFSVPSVEPMNFSKKFLSIDPYMLGCLLGDGEFNDPKQIRFTTQDEEIIERLKIIMGDRYDCIKEKRDNTNNNSNRFTFRYKDRFAYTHLEEYKQGVNPLFRFINDLGLRGTKSHTKFIPVDYLNSSIEQRKELLKGLMDTDGYINSQGYDIHYTTTSERLKDDVLYLVRSLGINASCSKFSGEGRDFWRVRLKPNFELFKLQRKLDRQKLRTNYNEKLSIVSIEKLNYKEESTCILVEDERHCYITTDFIPTHNSLKGCVPALYMFNFMPGSKTYIGSHLEEYAKKTWSMFMTYYNHLLQFTDLGKNYLVLRANAYLKSGYIEYVNGKPTEAGWQSEISVVTFKQSSESGVGGAIDLMILEEAGIFPNLADVIGYVTPACKDGDIITGHILAYGAAGSLEKAEPLRKLFYSPGELGFKEYLNNYDENKYGTYCGMFIPDFICRKPHIDKHGNSLIQAAIIARDLELEKLKKADYEKYMLKLSQHPNKPSEMFEMRSKARFNTKIIDQQIAFLETREGLGTAVELYRDIQTNKVKTKFSDKQPIRDYPLPKGIDKEGCVEIWEFPQENPPKGLYISSIDSYNQDDSSTTSLGCILLYKKVNTLSDEIGTSQILVAEYTGRPANKQEFYKICRMLLELYNASCLPENEDHELVPWFITNECDYLLADQPDIIRQILPNSTVKRTKGIHAATGLIIAGDQKIQRYLEKVIAKEYDEQGEVIKEKLGVTRILSLGLLKELRAYILDNNKNFDRVRTFEWLLLYEEETHFEEAKPYNSHDEQFFSRTKRFGKHTQYQHPRLTYN